MAPSRTCPRMVGDNGPVGTPRGRDAGGVQDLEVVPCNSPKRALASPIRPSHLVPWSEFKHFSISSRVEAILAYRKSH